MDVRRSGRFTQVCAMKPEKKSPLSWSVVVREARELMWAQRGRLGVGLLLMVVNRLAGLVLPASSKYLIDEVLARSNVEMLVPLALAVGVATVVQAGTTFSLSQIISVAAQRVIMNMRKQVQEQITRLPVRFFDDTKSGELISRIMTDPEGIRNLVGTGIIQLVGGIFTAVLALGVLFWLNWRLTTIILIVLALFGGGMALAFSRLRPIFRERREINAEVTARLNETLGGIRIVKAYSAESREQEAFSEGVERLFRNIARSITSISAVTAFGAVVIGAVGVVMIISGGRAILNETMTLGDLVMYIFFTGLMAAPIIQMASIGTQISEAFAGLDRIREVFSMTTEDAEDESREPLGEVEARVSFHDVTFAYNEGQPVLKGISFEAPSGTTTALVGSSGSGKSTLVSLVMAFNRPQQGRILLDGRSLDDIRVREYREVLGVVMQDNFLFDGTVADNIRFPKPEASREEVEHVGRIAHCEEFVSGFPDGYDSIVGERGVKLSGGQRQRVAIARAILADPKILILDEATSSLDTESEALIQEGLQRLRRGRTTFVIAHRLSTIRSADQILVLEGGEIVERGTHEELMLVGGRYRDLHDRQYAFEANRFVNPGEDY